MGASRAWPKPEAEHCVTPSGVDLNELWGVSEAIISPTCTEIGTGWRWRPSPPPWFLNHSFEVVPEGFEPAGDTPVADFEAKFEAVRYVIDPGTRRERTHVISSRGDVQTRISFGFPAFNSLAMGALKPLPPGTHVVETYWRFSAMHCDGIGDGAANCFPAGETQRPTLTFEVTPGHF